jgi:hypothetical protein
MTEGAPIQGARPVKHALRQPARALALSAVIVPGIGVGARGVGVVDLGLNQLGAAGNAGGVAWRSIRP